MHTWPPACMSLSLNFCTLCMFSSLSLPLSARGGWVGGYFFTISKGCVVPLRGNRAISATQDGLAEWAQPGKSHEILRHDCMGIVPGPQRGQTK